MSASNGSAAGGFSFQLEAECPHTGARAGRLLTPQGEVETPVFMPVGTQATVKALPQEWLEEVVGARLILGNTYHLYLRPGTAILEQLGGLPRFMNWPHALLTDSGGYQVYSLADRRKITDEGVTFASHIDGSRHLFTPENVVDIQRSIGATIQMVLDECPPHDCTPQYLRQSLARTHAWAARARTAFVARQEAELLYGYPQAQFGIVQGGTDKALRTESAERVQALDFEGYALGGLAVGEPEEALYETVAHTAPLLPREQPRYLMGVGTPANLLETLALGVDMWDCVLPSRNARHGLVYCADGIRNLKNARYADDPSPLDPLSPAPLDQRYSKAYLRHLFAAGEYLAYTLATAHNLHFFLWLTRTARQHILAGDFAAWKDALLPQVRTRH